MKPLGDTRRHFWLALRMARSGGLNLVEATDRGDLDQERWAGIIERCRCCTWTAGCERYLAQVQDYDSLPVNCRNRIQFAALRALEEMEKTYEKQHLATG